MAVASLILDGDLSMAIGAIIASTAASIVEICTITKPRVEWIKDINQAVSGKRQKTLYLPGEDGDGCFEILPIFNVGFEKPIDTWKAEVGLLEATSL